MKKKIICCFVLLLPFTGGFAQSVWPDDGRLLHVNGTELYVKTIGSGEPVIVVHGGPVLDHSYLFPHLQPISNDYRLIFFDQRLSGRSSADVDTSKIDLNTFVDDIKALQSVLGLKETHILGHSWGGLLAMHFAIEYPSRAKSLLLINTMAPTSELWQQEEAILAKQFTEGDSLARQEIMQSEAFRENPPEAIKQLLLLSFRSQFYNKEYADSLDLYVPEDYMTRSRLFGKLMPEIIDYDLTDELSQLNTPALIVYGSSEPASELSGPTLQKHLPNSELHIIEHSGHFPFIEQQQTFQKIILDFLKDKTR